MTDTNGTPKPDVVLNPALDLAPIRERFAATGRAQIEAVLDPRSAERFHTCLTKEIPWRLAYNDGPKALEMTPQQLQQMPPQEQVQFQSMIWGRAGQQFQYAYSDFPVAQTLTDPDHPKYYVHDVLKFINSDPFLDFLRDITGLEGKLYADGHATCFQSGHFLTIHDDRDDTRNRAVAYVFNMTPSWRADWGGALQFYDASFKITETFTPGFNVLNIFKVPQAHAVTFVPPYAKGGRYGMTGWFHHAD
jgi:Rps23 Pro-64 3,4-dihydroxylase Tpa1-like proline 4-hydroxylase